MNPVNVVIDTNVLVAALKSKRGASYKLLMSLADDICVPCVSVPLFVEYESVLKRPGLIDALSAEDIAEILDYLLSISSIRQLFSCGGPS